MRVEVRRGARGSARALALLCFWASVLVLRSAQAEPSYPAAYLDYSPCIDCHTSATPTFNTAGLTTFGDQWQHLSCYLNPWASAACAGLAAQDTDGDGYSNAQEINFDTNPNVPGDINECYEATGATCSANAYCDDTGKPGKGDWTCLCPAGFTTGGSGQSTTCTDIDECAVNQGGCTANSHCVNKPGSFTCQCDSGYFGNGNIAGGCSPHDYCFPAPCSPLSTCSAAGSAVSCSACPDGFRAGPGNTCVDIDECATNNGGCDPATVCTNTVGYRSCGACPPGSVGDGVSGCTPRAVIKRARRTRLVPRARRRNARVCRGFLAMA